MKRVLALYKKKKHKQGSFVILTYCMDDSRSTHL
jgi:hypothetical protein